MPNFSGGACQVMTVSFGRTTPCPPSVSLVLELAGRSLMSSTESAPGRAGRASQAVASTANAAQWSVQAAPALTPHLGALLVIPTIGVTVPAAVGDAGRVETAGPAPA